MLGAENILASNEDDNNTSAVSGGTVESYKAEQGTRVGTGTKGDAGTKAVTGTKAVAGTKAIPIPTPAHLASRQPRDRDQKKMVSPHP